MTTTSNHPPKLHPDWIGAAFGGLGLAMLSTDSNGHITLINDKACQILGVTASNAIGKSLGELISLLDMRENRPIEFPMQEIIGKGLKISTDEGYLLKENATGKRFTSFSMGPIQDEVGQVVGAVMTLNSTAVADGPQRKYLDAAQSPVVDSAEPELCNPRRQSIFVRSGGRYLRVLLEDLLWVEAMENYVQLQTVKDKIVVHTTLKGIGEALACRGFQRIHRSFIVKTEAIQSIEENHVTVQGTALPIGKSYRAELLAGLTLL